jgi:hypothetical protein
MLTPAKRLRLSKNRLPRSVIATSGCPLGGAAAGTIANEAGSSTHSNTLKVFMSNVKSLRVGANFSVKILMILLCPCRIKPYPCGLTVFRAVHLEEELMRSVTQFVFVAALLLGENIGSLQHIWAKQAQRKVPQAYCPR